MPSATLTSKGQITIPIQVRTALGLGTGYKVDFVEIEKGQFVIRARTASIRDLEGCVPRLDYVPTIEQINEAIADAATEGYLASVNETPASTSSDEAA